MAECCTGLRCELHAGGAGGYVCRDENCIPSGEPCPDDPEHGCCGGFCNQDGLCSYGECALEGEGCGGFTVCCSGLHCSGNDILHMECRPNG